MRYSFFIVSLFLSVFLCGCDQGTQILEPVMQKPVPQEPESPNEIGIISVIDIIDTFNRESIDKEQDCQFAKALIKEITALEGILCVSADMDYVDMLSECHESENSQQRSQILKKLTERLTALKGMESQCNTSVFGEGARVIVKNTIHLGLIIRDAPDGNQIGGMFDGETGTLLSDGETARGLVWYEIEWDKPVKNPESGCGDRDVCIGWSVAVVENGTEILELID